MIYPCAMLIMYLNKISGKIEAESLFELFYRKVALLHSVSIDSTDL